MIDSTLCFDGLICVLLIPDSLLYTLYVPSKTFYKRVYEDQPAIEGFIGNPSFRRPIFGPILVLSGRLRAAQPVMSPIKSSRLKFIQSSEDGFI